MGCDIMLNLLTDDLCKELWSGTIKHCAAYRAKHNLTTKKERRRDVVECAIHEPEKVDPCNAVRLWICAKLLAAQLAPEIYASSLWDPKSALYDEELDTAMTKRQFEWLCRHVSFGEYDENSPNLGAEDYDK